MKGIRNLNSNKTRNINSILLLYEGDTEKEFYDLVIDKFLPKRAIRISKSNLKGVYNINFKVKNKINNFLTQSDDKNITVIVAHDREGPRDMESPFNADLLKETFKSKKRIADVYDIVATQDIESWFFHDIEGIYEFLRVPKTRRSSRKYNNVESLNNADLSRLFRSRNNYYQKGFKVDGFLNSLDLNKIVERTVELQDFISIITRLCR